MKRIGKLYPTFCSFGNLLDAYHKTRRGCRKNAERADFYINMEKELLLLAEELKAECWQPQPYRCFDIYDPKHRTIAVSAFRDRVVHHALVNILEPIYERCFIQHSYATRKDKGVHAAVAQAQVFLRRQDWFLKSDVEKYFDSIDHNILLGMLERKIKDRSLLRTMERIVRHGSPTGKGLPIGNRTSQFFANVYLHPFDLFLQQNLRAKGYVRYMDDFVVFSGERSELKRIKSEAAGFLGEELKLSLKPEATYINSHLNGLSFLGRRIFRSIIRLRPENLRRITRRMAQREYAFMEGRIEESAFLDSMNSYWAMLSHLPLRPLRQSLLR
jgi:RNA-directed DNA polymerase